MPRLPPRRPKTSDHGDDHLGFGGVFLLATYAIFHSLQIGRRDNGREPIGWPDFDGLPEAWRVPPALSQALRTTSSGFVRILTMSPKP